MARSDDWPARFPGHVFPQVIPVPDDIQPGSPAPWSHLNETSRSGFTLERIENSLRNANRHLDDFPLPGDPVEMTAVADAKKQEITRRSAVLVALFEEDGEAHVVLTRRSFEMRHHRGEVALPGGRSDLDENPVATALREAQEEVGLNLSEVRTIGWLSPIVTFASGSAIWPVVAVLARRPELVPDPIEVDRAFTISLKDLVADEKFLEERWRRDLARPGSDEEGYFPLYFFAVPGDIIWGATARVLTELLCLLCEVPWPDANRSWG